MLIRNPRFALLFASLFLVMVGFGLVIPLLPFVARDLGASSFDMGLLTSVWAAAQFLTAPRWGTVSDRRGRRPTLILGLVGFGLGFFLMGFSTELWMLYLARIIGGLLSASTIPSAKAYIADITPPEERGPSMGLLGAAFGLGFMLGPSIGTIMAPLGVRFTFFAAGACGCINALLVLLFLPEPEERIESGMDGGSVLSAMIDAARRPHAVLYWTPFFITFASSSLFSMMGFFLMDKFAAAESQVGIAFTVNGAIGVLIQGILIGVAIRTFGEIRLLRGGMLLSALGFIVFTLAPSFPLILVSVAFIATGMGLARPVVTSLLCNVTDMGQGITMGLQTSYDSLGRMLGPLWAGLLYMITIEAPYISSAMVFALAFLYVERTHAVLRRPPADALAPDAGMPSTPPPAPAHRQGGRLKD
ncbi:MAG: MFS transporter [Bacillota bacterium]